MIAGEIGSGALGYTAVGEQVGMAQRMESVAPPGGVMLSASTARLVEARAMLGRPRWSASRAPRNRCPRPSAAGHGRAACAAGALSRIWLVAMGDVRRRGHAGACVDGHGAVVGVGGPPGIGKSRLVRELWRWRAPWCRGVHHLLRVAHQPGSLPCRGTAAARGHRGRGS